MLSQRATTLLFSCVTALSSGTNYAFVPLSSEASFSPPPLANALQTRSFSAWAPQTASQLHLSTLALNVVGAAGNAGVYLSGPVVGGVNDKRGPRVVLLGAAASLVCGYLGLFLLYTGGEEGLYGVVGLPGLAICQILTGVGGSAGLAAAVKATSASFSKTARGAAMATVLSCFGLSAFFYSTLAHANLFSSSDPTSGFLLTLALGCGISILLGATFVRPPLIHPHPTSASDPPASTSRNQYLAVSTMDEDEPHSHSHHDAAASEYSLHSPHSPVDSPVTRRSLDGAERGPERPRSRARQRSTSPLLLKERDDEDDAPHGAGDLDVSGMALLRSSDFWLLFTFLGLCSGVGLMYINNIGSVTLTLASLDRGADPLKAGRQQAHLVSVLSVANCLGRLFVGYASDLFTHHAPLKLRFSRIWWLVVTAVFFVLSQLVASRAETVGALTLPTLLLGGSYGMLFGSVPVCCLERFGMANYSANNGWLTMAPALSAPFTNLLFGWIYDSHVPLSPPTSDDPLSFSPASLASTSTTSLLKRAGGSAPAHLCLLGNACFRSAFHATTFMSLLAVGVAVVLSLRRSFKPVYHT